MNTNTSPKLFIHFPVFCRPVHLLGWICAFAAAVLLEAWYITQYHGSVLPFVNGTADTYALVAFGGLGLMATCCMLCLLLETSRVWLAAEALPKRTLCWAITGGVVTIIIAGIVFLNWSIGTFEYLNIM